MTPDKVPDQPSALPRDFIGDFYWVRKSVRIRTNPGYFSAIWRQVLLSAVSVSIYFAPPAHADGKPPIFVPGETIALQGHRYTVAVADPVPLVQMLTAYLTAMGDKEPIVHSCEAFVLTGADPGFTETGEAAMCRFSDDIGDREAEICTHNPDFVTMSFPTPSRATWEDWIAKSEECMKHRKKN